jgi:hypothetical protein
MAAGMAEKCPARCCHWVAQTGELQMKSKTKNSVVLGVLSTMSLALIMTACGKPQHNLPAGAKGATAKDATVAQTQQTQEQLDARNALQDPSNPTLLQTLIRRGMTTIEAEKVYANLMTMAASMGFDNYLSPNLHLELPPVTGMGIVRLNKEDAKTLFSYMGIAQETSPENNVYAAGVKRIGPSIACYNQGLKATPQKSADHCILKINYATGEVEFNKGSKPAAADAALPQDYKGPNLQLKFSTDETYGRILLNGRDADTLYKLLLATPFTIASKDGLVQVKHGVNLDCSERTIPAVDVAAAALQKKSGVENIVHLCQIAIDYQSGTVKNPSKPATDDQSASAQKAAGRADDSDVQTNSGLGITPVPFVTSAPLAANSPKDPSAIPTVNAEIPARPGKNLPPIATGAIAAPSANSPAQQTEVKLQTSEPAKDTSGSWISRKVDQVWNRLFGTKSTKTLPSPKPVIEPTASIAPAPATAVPTEEKLDIPAPANSDPGTPE